MRLILRWIVGALALFATVKIGEALGIGLGLSRGQTEGIGAALVVVAILSLVNAFVRPIVSLLTLPLNCLTLGLFSFVVNALMFLLVNYLNVGLYVKDFWAALFASVAYSVLSGLLSAFIPDGKER
jgi:putative membrane protein